jgi:hypothetical protein
VIIHGFSSLPAEKRLKLLIKKIKDEFPKAKIIVPNYLEKYQRPAIFTAGKKSIWEYAEDCKRIIEKEKREGPLFIVAFSLGGLIARVDVEQKGIEAHAVILVGTPNKGIKLNRWEKLILKIFKRPAIEETLPNSQFLRKLNEDYSKLQLKTKYYLLAGSKDKRVPIWSALGIEFIKSDGTFIGSTDHSGLIPKEPKSTPNAIDIIIQILKSEAGFQSASFLLEKIVKLNRSQPKLKISVLL